MKWMSKILDAVAAFIRATWNVLQEARNGLARLMGSGTAQMPEQYVPETGVEDVLDEIQKRASRIKSSKGEVVGNLGRAIHQYASALASIERSAVDLTSLDAVQTDWLLALSDADLAKLAKVGPRRCESLVRGQQAGIVGFPLPARQKELMRPACRGRTDSKFAPKFVPIHVHAV